ncbi:MAG: hypothetical protein MUO55_06875 [Candidatus Atribacteria bacterium]|nr:hypothetical protein [Candidatus Atribacteria bacterium]
MAESFGHIFHRNALNVGLPAVKYSGIVKEVKQGSLIQINIKEGLIFLSASRKTLSIEKYLLQLLIILENGGLISYLRKFGKHSHLKNI